jgi:hypothetical protein
MFIQKLTFLCYGTLIFPASMHLSLATYKKIHNTYRSIQISLRKEKKKKKFITWAQSDILHE